MKNKITEAEAKTILNKLISLRKKSKNNIQLLQEYDNYETYCANLFDYLVVARTGRYSQFPNHQDLQQEGRIGLLLALRTFDARDNTSFFWWANQYIKTKVSRAANCHSTIKVPIKKAKEHKPLKAAGMPVFVYHGQDPVQSIEEKEIIVKMNNAINELPEDQRKIIQLNGIKDYSVTKICSELKMSRIKCVELLNAAKENLKQTLIGQEI